MEDAFTLVVLTLLQLCRAQISNTEWYAANLINDPSYTPKPITEIFTTDLNFSPKIPTISTQANPRNTPPVTTTSSAPTTTTFVNRDVPTQQNQVQRVPFQIVELPGPQQPQIITQAVNDPKNELSSFLLIFDPRQQTSQILQQPISTPPPTSIATPSTTTETPTTSMRPPSTTVPSQPSTQTQSNAQEMTIMPRILQPRPIPLEPFVVPPSFNPGRWDLRNIVNPIPNFPIVNIGCNSTTVPNTVDVSSTITPQTVRPAAASSNPFLTVRLKTPKGSLTNIRINPTTTKKPTTTRRRKSNRKTDYEICLKSCDGKKDPICSSPMGVFPINPDRLKGFASLCHMACHNSFRKDQVYEKVTEGRCGRLRTRIRPVDKNKLNREELNKAQYTIQHNGPETIMEFSPLSR